MAENFLDVQQGKQEPITQLVSDSHKTNVQNNKHVLKQIIETLILCGRQNIPIRGHTEDRSNFMAILRYKAESDNELALHLGGEANPRAKYTSPDVQNELLSILGHSLTEKILTECNSATCFALLADECSDRSTKEQISICLRFVDNKSIVREDFLDFVEATSTKGADIANSLIDTLRKYDIDIKKMRAQGYDGAANMSGKIKGVKARICEIVPDAKYVHCKAHCLNLAIIHACKIPSIRTMMATVQDIAFCFDYSAKRLKAFYDELSNDQTAQENLNGRTKLRTLCETRWTSRADALSTFKSAYEVVVHCLEYLNENGDEKAGMRLAAVTKFDFIIGLVVAEHTMQNTVNLSYLLQSKNCDILEAVRESEVIIRTFQNERADQLVWDTLYQSSTTIANAVGIEAAMPRIVNRQIHRSNQQAHSISEYWQRSLYYPFIDHLTTELTDRLFTAEERFVAGFLLPRKVQECTQEITGRIFQEYSQDLPQGQASFTAEVNRWKTRWSMLADLPSTLSETLAVTNKVLYPEIHTTLTVLLTMPPSTATAERSFSVMKRLKTYLRSTMMTERMANLAKLHIYRDVEINVDNIIERFADSRKRRLEFV